MTRLFRSRNVAIAVAVLSVVAILALVLPRRDRPADAGGAGATTAAATAPAAVDGAASPSRASLDRGNAEYRAGRYDSALVHYRAAAAASPASASAWFGIHMAATKLGRTALVDTARQELARRVDTTGTAGLTNAHPTVRSP